jgi:hypothetical protein
MAASRYSLIGMESTVTRSARGTIKRARMKTPMAKKDVPSRRGRKDRIPYTPEIFSQRSQRSSRSTQTLKVSSRRKMNAMMKVMATEITVTEIRECA